MENYQLHQKGEACWLTFPQLDAYPELAHLFTTRRGGVSTGSRESWNFGKSKEESAENFLQNYRILADVMETEAEKMVRTNQTHTANILAVDERHLGMGITRDRDYEDIDGLVTNCRGITLITSHGDCNALFFYDPVHSVIGLAHSGWRGTLAEIAGEMIEKMQDLYGSKPEEILVGIGPALCQDCFEVDEDVAELFFRKHAEWWGYSREGSRNGVKKYYIDLKGILRWTLEGSGVSTGHIFDMKLCTGCHPEWFYSYRRQKGKNGNMSAAMMLKDANCI